MTFFLYTPLDFHAFFVASSALITIYPLKYEEIKTEISHYQLKPGLILVIFFTEPVGLAPRSLTEPERKTMSPVEMLCQFLPSISLDL